MTFLELTNQNGEKRHYNMDMVEEIHRIPGGVLPEKTMLCFASHTVIVMETREYILAEGERVRRG